MTDAPALLAAIRSAPDDDAPRLVYADWLDEHGQPERAEFIRVQCELARRESEALRSREAELLAAHHDAFAGPLAAPHLRFRFDRGLIVAFGHTGVFVHSARSPTTESMWDYTYIQFMLDGRARLVQASSTNGPTEADRILAGAMVKAVPANLAFELDAISNPAGLRIHAQDGGRLRVMCPRRYDLRGAFVGTGLDLAIYKNRRRSRHEFTHVDVVGLSSLPESPQDAV